MNVFNKHKVPSKVSPRRSASSERGKDEITAVQQENAPPPSNEFKVSRAGGGDTALELFGKPEDVNEPYDAVEENRLVRKIDWMILPYLAVCYAFFYIDKTTLSYAAIFGIEEDLDLKGTKYNWLSSIFYFGFLVWAFPTNYMMQKFPVAKYLGVNVFLWGVLLMCQAASSVRRGHCCSGTK